MSDVDEIAIGLAKSLHQQHAELEQHVQSIVERVVGRAVLRIGMVGAASAVITIGGSIWAVRGYVDALEQANRGRDVEVHELRERVTRFDQVRELAVATKAEADITAGKLDGHLRPDPEVRRR